ncbi:hypothetical protein SKAU_G00142470 [Synaphobranchus kaupii]|uniref:Uncharacterized protein n=1 Tax=Synaphobranchus kaupii TaxID=118154 RepID=A0A9Q1FT50_SYNKA|nr:hypothetical protein SKAU_G00142470 [Synaphobranchus kaupii]
MHTDKAQAQYTWASGDAHGQRTPAASPADTGVNMAALTRSTGAEGSLSRGYLGNALAPIPAGYSFSPVYRVSWALSPLLLEKPKSCSPKETARTNQSRGFHPRGPGRVPYRKLAEDRLVFKRSRVERSTLRGENRCDTQDSEGGRTPLLTAKSRIPRFDAIAVARETRIPQAATASAEAPRRCALQRRLGGNAFARSAQLPTPTGTAGIHQEYSGAVGWIMTLNRIAWVHMQTV